MNISSSLHLRTVGLSLGLIVAVLMAATASAGTITSSPAPVASGPGLGTVAVPAIITVMPDNDNVPDPGKLDNNIFVPIKRFDHSGIIDIEFSVAPSSGVTEYQVFESVDNNTGVPWNLYTMELGFGSGAGFVKSLAGDGLDFDTGPPGGNDLPPTSSVILAVVGRPDEDTLVYSGGIHGTGAESYQFRIDVPNLGATGAISTFTLRQFPRPVPEPSTLALLGLAIAGFAARRSRS